jgi:UDP-2,3-diacylglucosamine pyrophosphatase LpxH
MRKEVIILGDIEMGGGTLTDDFIADDSLAKLIKKYASKKNSVELVFNGDTFDFLKCPYINESGRRTYPRHVTTKISLKKLHDIHLAHKIVFDALNNFLKKNENQVTFVIGNHDHDLFFKEVQKELKKMITSKKNVSFGLNYKKYGIYTEHGQQYDFLNRINKKKPFVKYKGQKILNIPWISLGIISNFLTLKEEHPFLERIFPRPVLFTQHKTVMKKLSWRSIDYLFKSLFYYPLRYINDPTYFVPRTLMRELYRRLKKVHWDVDSIVAVFKRRKRQFMKKHRLHVLGHVHKNYVEEGPDGWALIHPDTWRDEYTIDEETKKIKPKIKKYVQVIIENELVSEWKLLEIPLKQKIYDFNKLIKNEIIHIRKAAKAENYKFKG